jgi:hypothetical protein
MKKLRYSPALGIALWHIQKRASAAGGCQRFSIRKHYY